MKLSSLVLLTALQSTTVPAFALDTPYPYPIKGQVTYEVPVTDTSLKPFATFTIEDAKSTEQDEQVQIRYTLPLALTGVKNEIVLTSTNNLTNGTYTNFEGPNGAANCNKTSCNVRYQNLTIDIAAARQNLLDQGIQGAELAKRMQVVSAFSGDPAGVVRFKR